MKYFAVSVMIVLMAHAAVAEDRSYYGVNGVFVKAESCGQVLTASFSESTFCGFTGAGQALMAAKTGAADLVKESMNQASLSFRVPVAEMRYSLVCFTMSRYHGTGSIQSLDKYRNYETQCSVLMAGVERGIILGWSEKEVLTCIRSAVKSWKWNQEMTRNFGIAAAACQAGSNPSILKLFRIMQVNAGKLLAIRNDDDNDEVTPEEPVDPEEPPVDPEVPPVDPEVPPVDPEVPPVDPEVPPVDPEVPPVDPTVPPTTEDLSQPWWNGDNPDGMSTGVNGTYWTPQDPIPAAQIVDALEKTADTFLEKLDQNDGKVAAAIIATAHQLLGTDQDLADYGIQAGKTIDYALAKVFKPYQAFQSGYSVGQSFSQGDYAGVLKNSDSLLKLLYKSMKTGKAVQ
ncbi:MAG: hypothetical protein PHW04_05485 [Candidatus Wallbacteria bacterium]|nr:hypothetical protein [Candidatus Wallbacteria bacterium]